MKLSPLLDLLYKETERYLTISSNFSEVALRVFLRIQQLDLRDEEAEKEYKPLMLVGVMGACAEKLRDNILSMIDGSSSRKIVLEDEFPCTNEDPVWYSGATHYKREIIYKRKGYEVVTIFGAANFTGAERLVM